MSDIPQRSDPPHPHAVGPNGTGGSAGTGEGHDAWIGGMGGDQTAGNSAARQSQGEACVESGANGAAVPGAANLVPV